MESTESAPTPYEPGAPVPGLIPLCVPELRGNEWAYIKQCLDTNWVSSVGSFVDRFEQMVADYVGAQYAVATVNGTAALHIALLVAGIEPEDEVLVPTLTFIAPANAVRYVGAVPILIDVEPQYWQMDPQRVSDFLQKECHWQQGCLRNRTTGRRVRAILPVHILGHPVEFDAIRAIAQEYELLVIEDAAEGLGAKYQGQAVGHLGDISCLSFNGNKLITTGGGGMIVTDNPIWAKRARYLTTQAKDDPIEYIHDHIGYNYRLTNLQAAMGCAQMENLDAYITIKRRIAQTYSEQLQSMAGMMPMVEADWACSSYWLYTTRIDAAVTGWDSRQLLQHLSHAQIQTRPLWCPLHQSKAHAQSPVYGGEVAERLYRQALSLPCSVGLLPTDQDRVLSTIQQFYRLTPP